LREKFFAGNLGRSSSADVRSASTVVALKRDSVMCTYWFS
jgi:hypothetical protein